MNRPLLLVSFVVLFATPLAAQTNAPAASPVIATLDPAPASPAYKKGTKVELHLKDGGIRTGTLVQVDPLFVCILTSEGGCKVAFDEMSDEDKQNFGFSQKLEDATKAQRAAVQKKQDQQWRAKMAIEQAQLDSAAAAKAAEEAAARHFARGQQLVIGTVFQIVRGSSPGLLVDIGGAGDVDVVFIENLSAEKVDGRVSVPCVISGTYSYETIRGENRMVTKFEPVPSRFVNQHLYDGSKTHFSMDDADPAHQ